MPNHNKNKLTEAEGIWPFKEEFKKNSEEVILNVSKSGEASAFVQPGKPIKVINTGDKFVDGMKHVWGPYCYFVPNISLRLLTSAERKKRRHFSTAEREALYIAADGKCMICGCILEGDNWQPDHIVPFSKGGLTDVINGQALCTPCNLKKGDR
ncbi:HNH endonuclease [Paracoccaceae bacterium]|nr:HNH endonuclease [Paracoccaceae bacterium]